MNTSVSHTLKTVCGIFAVLLVVGVALESAWAGNEVTSAWDGIKDTFDDGDMIDALVGKVLAEHDIVASPEKAVIKYVMYPGDYIADSSVLSDFFPTEFDIFVFILVGNGDWYMEIKDC
ncbi:MAG: hypothetical protein ACE5PV_24920 [Candidatus Poribacteria bacterium]